NSNCKLWWSHPLAMDMKEIAQDMDFEPLKIAQLGQGLCVLMGCSDSQTGETRLLLLLYRIMDSTSNPDSSPREHALSRYHVIDIPFPPSQAVVDSSSLSNLHLGTTWDYRGDTESNGIDPQVVPVAMIWSDMANSKSSDSAFFAVAPLINQNDDNDEVWQGIQRDYRRLYGYELCDNESPDHETAVQHMVTTINWLGDWKRTPSIDVLDATSPSTLSPAEHGMAMFGGGIVTLPYDFARNVPANGASRSVRGKQENKEDGNIQEQKWMSDDNTEEECNLSLPLLERDLDTWEDHSDVPSVSKRNTPKQLTGGGYAYFLNEKYQVMRVKFSLSCARAAKVDMFANNKELKQRQNERHETMMKLAFTLFEHGPSKYARASRVAQELINLSSQEFFLCFHNTNYIRKHIHIYMYIYICICIYVILQVHILKKKIPKIVKHCGEIGREHFKLFVV
ncbi:hypothetical protein RFI_13758, partial [Reticulomyxa filosa]